MVDYTPWPEHIVFPVENPILSKWVRWSVSNNLCYQPECTVSTILCGAAAVMGQMYLISNEFCNIYNVNLINTGRGKDGVLRGMTDMLCAAGYESMIGASAFSSGPGVLNELMKRSGRIIWPIDELAPDLRAIVSSSAASHKEEILSYLLSMSSRKKFVKELAKSHFEITDPCPIVAANCQPQLFWSTINSEKMLTSGFANRFLITMGDNYARPGQYLEYTPPDEDVVNYLKLFDTSDYGAGTVNAIEGNRKVIILDDEAKEYWAFKSTMNFDIIDDAQRLSNDIPARIMIRDTFKAMKLAAIYAWLKDYNNPVIDISAAKWAWYIINNTSESIIKAMGEHSYASKDEQDTKQLLTLVGARVKGIDVKELRTKCASFALKFDGILNHCLSTRQVNTASVEGRSGKKLMVTIVRES